MKRIPGAGTASTAETENIKIAERSILDFLKNI
jgi:hypothetical protein